MFVNTIVIVRSLPPGLIRISRKQGGPVFYYFVPPYSQSRGKIPGDHHFYVVSGVTEEKQFVFDRFHFLYAFVKQKITDSYRFDTAFIPANFYVVPDNDDFPERISDSVQRALLLNLLFRRRHRKGRLNI